MPLVHTTSSSSSIPPRQPDTMETDVGPAGTPTSSSRVGTFPTTDTTWVTGSRERRSRPVFWTLGDVLEPKPRHRRGREGSAGAAKGFQMVIDDGNCLRAPVHAALLIMPKDGRGREMGLKNSSQARQERQRGIAPCIPLLGAVRSLHCLLSPLGRRLRRVRREADLFTPSSGVSETVGF